MEDVRDNEELSPSRRDVLKVMAVAVGGVAAGVGGSMLLPHWDTARSGGWRFFTPHEAKLVEAICEQIVPADQDPGARDAGVVFFIDRQLVGPYVRFQSKYRQGLVSIQQTSRKTFGNTFEQLAFDDQTTLLKSIEAGKAPKDLWRDPGQQEFFGLVRDHTMQGFYGSPRHGGNREYASYKMLGLEYPRVMGQNRYREPLA